MMTTTTIKQRFTWDCGLACLAMALQSHASEDSKHSEDGEGGTCTQRQPQQQREEDAVENVEDLRFAQLSLSGNHEAILDDVLEAFQAYTSGYAWTVELLYVLKTAFDTPSTLCTTTTVLDADAYADLPFYNNSTQAPTMDRPLHPQHHQEQQQEQQEQQEQQQRERPLDQSHEDKEQQERSGQEGTVDVMSWALDLAAPACGSMSTPTAATTGGTTTACATAASTCGPSGVVKQSVAQLYETEAPAMVDARLTLEELLTLRANGLAIIVLVNVLQLDCRDCGLPTADYTQPYIGHYIVFEGLAATTGEQEHVVFRDPGQGRCSEKCAVRREVFDAARTARGTDDDILVVGATCDQPCRQSLE
ncbi:hypothetical protein PTSG_08584 [Salpingoeca rosetta]|uniref:Guanylyl cyclase n=1 Tax=Salpingoeca rosetta (strain ATCC 50818 / BSB-021) TaxID=946362 RepID=F2UK38_SALR5|nr:uncharacterized protein PTSG_08584 [Salpingoeca rosetta]EGD77487.1 hypothetical protein PTSG_08584 [Salpingoeca rosetta]|eukprot:XP_004990375.1 hypothetical protein PTSG_08584 [Salpingoeca rosetta]